MLRKKYTIQKSIRFDEKLANDLEFLANELERTQNDLVNIAAEDLIKENSYYFKKLIIVEQLFRFFDGTLERDFIKFDNLKVAVSCSDDDNNFYKVEVEILDKNEVIIDKFEKTSNNIDEVYNDIVDLTDLHIDINSDVVKQYLQNRLDYK